MYPGKACWIVAGIFASLLAGCAVDSGAEASSDGGFALEAGRV